LRRPQAVRDLPDRRLRAGVQPGSTNPLGSPAPDAEPEGVGGQETQRAQDGDRRQPRVAELRDDAGEDEADVAFEDGADEDGRKTPVNEKLFQRLFSFVCEAGGL